MKKLILVLMVMVSCMVMADVDIDNIELSFETNVMSQIVDITKQVETEYEIDPVSCSAAMYLAAQEYIKVQAEYAANPDKDSTEDQMSANAKAYVMAVIYITLTNNVRNASGNGAILQSIYGDNTPSVDKFRILGSEAGLNYNTNKNGIYVPVFSSKDAKSFMDSIMDDCKGRPMGRAMFRYECSLSECLNSVIAKGE